MKDLIPAKQWFRAHVDDILQTYHGAEHLIGKEELFLGVFLNMLCVLTYLSIFI